MHPEMQPRFWVRGQPPTMPMHPVLVEGTLQRLGKLKPLPEPYHFTLHADGVLVYRKSTKQRSAKGWVRLGLDYFVKLVDLKSQASTTNPQQNADIIRAFRIRKYANTHWYFWHED